MADDLLLLETGTGTDHLLLESGDDLLLESSTGGGATEAGPLVNSQRLKGLTGGALAA